MPFGLLEGQKLAVSWAPTGETASRDLDPAAGVQAVRSLTILMNVCGTASSMTAEVSLMHLSSSTTNPSCTAQGLPNTQPKYS